MKKELLDLIGLLESQDEERNNQANGLQALTLIDKILSIEPLDLETRIIRMRLHTDWVFDNSTEIIKDAEFIAENVEFGKDRMVGYDWLTWVYGDLLALPEKAIETIENQLMDMHIIFDKRYEKDELEGLLLSKMGFIRHNEGKNDVAMQLWDKSCEKDPFINERNGVAGMLALDRKEWDKAYKFLRNHFDWSFDAEDGYRIQYGLKLKEIYTNNKLEEHQGLIAILFHVIRNEKFQFDIQGNMDYINAYLPELEMWAEKFPRNSRIWTAIGNTYFFDTKNYEKALDAYIKSMEGDDPTNTPLDRIIKSAKKMKVDLLTLPFKIEGPAVILYNYMTDMPKGKKKKQKKQFIELKCKFGEQCYNKYKAYFIDGEGNSEDNQAHVFAMACNNYGLALYNYKDLVVKKKGRDEVAAYAASIHIQGYEMSPFHENLGNGAQAFYEAKMYDECIKYYNQYIEEYSGSVSLFDLQTAYWYIAYSYSKQNMLDKTRETYERAKALYLKTGAGVTDATNKFIYVAKENYYNMVYKAEAYVEAIPELLWFVEQNLFAEINSKEVGLIYYYLGDCYRKTKQKEKAISAYQESVNLLEGEEDFYGGICEESSDYIKSLGGKAKRKKRKGLLQRLFDL